MHFILSDADDVLRAELHSQWQNHHWSFYQLQFCCGNAELKSWCNQRFQNGKFKLRSVEEMRRDLVSKLISKVFQVTNQCLKMQSCHCRLTVKLSHLLCEFSQVAPHGQLTSPSLPQHCQLTPTLSQLASPPFYIKHSASLDIPMAY